MTFGQELRSPTVDEIPPNCPPLLGTGGELQFDHLASLGGGQAVAGSGRERWIKHGLHFNYCCIHSIFNLEPILTSILTPTACKGTLPTTGELLDLP